eukprot:3940582-Rhodomonas_salina.1
MPCPVLNYPVLLPSYAMSGTELSYVRTELRNGATESRVLTYGIVLQAKEGLGELEGALSDVRETCVRYDPTLPPTLHPRVSATLLPTLSDVREVCSYATPCATP